MVAQYSTVWINQSLLSQSSVSGPLGCVLVYLSCNNKIPQTGRGAYKQQKCITVLELGSSRSRRWYGCVLMKALLQMAGFLLSPHRVGGDGELSWVSFIRALTPLMRALTCQRPHLLISSHWELGLQHLNFVCVV